jgi:hypothetical protein
MVQHSSVQISTDIDAMKEKVAESLRGIQEAAVNAGKSFTQMATDAAAAGRDMVPIIADIRARAIAAFGTEDELGLTPSGPD